MQPIVSVAGGLELKLLMLAWLSKQQASTIEAYGWFNCV